MEFGCFVELTGMQRAEGMVHVSNISKRPISSAKEAVKRGQEVWVKVRGQEVWVKVGWGAACASERWKGLPR
eukprot:103502-Chlamydomonas_euryale.AAC.1